MNTNRTTYHIKIEGGLWTIDEDEASRKSIEDLGRYKAAFEEAKASIIASTDTPPIQHVSGAPATGPLNAPKVMLGGYATRAMMSDEIDKRIRIVSDEIDRKAMNEQYKEAATRDALIDPTIAARLPGMERKKILAEITHLAEDSGIYD